MELLVVIGGVMFFLVILTIWWNSYWGYAMLRGPKAGIYTNLNGLRLYYIMNNHRFLKWYNQEIEQYRESEQITPAEPVIMPVQVQRPVKAPVTKVTVSTTKGQLPGSGSDFRIDRYRVQIGPNGERSYKKI